MILAIEELQFTFIERQENQRENFCIKTRTHHSGATEYNIKHFRNSHTVIIFTSIQYIVYKPSCVTT